jgi:hypothetical protein
MAWSLYLLNGSGGEKVKVIGRWVATKSPLLYDVSDKIPMMLG